MSDVKIGGLMGLLGKRVEKNVKFLGEDVKIRKLTVGEVKKIQELAKELEGKEDSDGLDILELVIKSSIAGAEALTRENFEEWPMDELSKLSNAIM
jgi:hypothetical protein